MTRQRMTRLGPMGLVLIGALGLALGACSDDTTQPVDSGVDQMTKDVDVLVDTAPQEASVDLPVACVLRFDTINGKAASQVSKLTAADDKNTATPDSIDIDVDVAGAGLSDGKTLTLAVTKVASDQVAQATSGKASFANVPVPATVPGNTVLLRVSAPGCTPATLTLALETPPSCIFIAPADKQTLGKGDDEDSGTGAFDYTVKLRTQNAEGGHVTVRVDGAVVGTVDPIPAGGAVSVSTTFPNKTFPLVAEVELNGVKSTCTITATVSTDAPQCDLELAPKPVVLIGPGVAGDGIGVAQDAEPSSKDVINSNITVMTEVGADVTLLIDKVAAKTVTADATGKAVFNAQQLLDGPRSIEANCVSKVSGNSNQTPGQKVTVDAKPPGLPKDFVCTVTDRRAGEIACSWTSAGKTEEVRYAVRYATAALTETTWAAAQATEMLATPFPVGQKQEVVFKGLTLGASLYFGVRAQDRVQNLSPLAATTLALIAAPNVDHLVGVPEPTTGPANWGAAMATGDFDCDGYTDLAVGDQAASGHKGRVAIYPGSAGGFLASPTTFISGSAAGGRFGAKIAALPSFKGNAGCSDLAVVASHDNTSAAKVYVYMGRANFFDRDDSSTGSTTGGGAELILALPSNAGANAKLGEAIASVGDFNGDTLTDLAISYRDSTGTNDTASVLVVFGDSTIPMMATGVAPKEITLDIATPAGFGAQITGGKASESFGLVLGGGASLDGDTNADLLIGATGVGNGTVYVVKGDAAAAPQTIPLTDTRVVAIAGATTNVSFGDQVAYVGDMDKDGSPEFAVSDTGVGAGAGHVYVFNLKGTPAPASPADAVFEIANDVTGAAGDSFGVSIAAGDRVGLAGADMNKDGYADLIVGAAAAGPGSDGAVYQFNGAVALSNTGTSKADYVFVAPTNAVTFGTNIVLGKDFNDKTGLGYNDLAVGDPLYAESGQTVGRVTYFD
ncbi:MAG: FG-GAP repeat protein [Deltaproteobacteria bacterium]|nr:FG-GAP repeat protein [Deltaproteobacteria bacterium]